MTIKDEFIHALERIAATLPSKKVTVVLCCETEEAEPATFYGSTNKKANITVMSVTSQRATINNILKLSLHEAQQALYHP